MQNSENNEVDKNFVDVFVQKIRHKKEKENTARKEREERRKKMMYDQKKAFLKIEEKRKNELLTQELLKQSKLERSLAKKLFRIQQWKQVLMENRKLRQQQIEERIHADKKEQMEKIFSLEQKQVEDMKLTEEQIKKKFDEILAKMQEEDDQEDQKIQEAEQQLTQRKAKDTSFANDEENAENHLIHDSIRQNLFCPPLNPPPFTDHFPKEKEFGEVLEPILQNLDSITHPFPDEPEEPPFQSSYKYRLAITGKPLSGKSEIANALASQLNLFVIDLAKNLEAEMKQLIEGKSEENETSAISKIHALVIQGQNVPPSLIGEYCARLIDLIEKKMKKETTTQYNGWILDSYLCEMDFSLLAEKFMSGYDEEMIKKFNNRRSSAIMGVLGPKNEENKMESSTVRQFDVTSFPFRAFSSIIFLDIDNDEIFKRSAAQKIDPTTGKQYHMTYDPPSSDSNIKTKEEYEQLLLRLVPSFYQKRENGQTMNESIKKFENKVEGIKAWCEKIFNNVISCKVPPTSISAEKLRELLVFSQNKKRELEEQKALQQKKPTPAPAKKKEEANPQNDEMEDLMKQQREKSDTLVKTLISEIQKLEQKYEVLNQEREEKKKQKLAKKEEEAKLEAVAAPMVATEPVKQLQLTETKFSEEIASKFENLWFNFEKTYMTNLEELFHGFLSEKSTFCSQMEKYKAEFEQLLIAPLEENQIIAQFEKDFNSYKDEIRSALTMKNQSHKKLDELSQKLFASSDKKRDDANAQVKKIQEGPTIPTFTLQLKMKYLRWIQNEIDRYAHHSLFFRDYLLELYGIKKPVAENPESIDRNLTMKQFLLLSPENPTIATLLVREDDGKGGKKAAPAPAAAKKDPKAEGELANEPALQKLNELKAQDFSLQKTIENLKQKVTEMLDSLYSKELGEDDKAKKDKKKAAPPPKKKGEKEEIPEPTPFEKYQNVPDLQKKLDVLKQLFFARLDAIISNFESNNKQGLDESTSILNTMSSQLLQRVKHENGQIIEIRDTVQNAIELESQCSHIEMNPFCLQQQK